MKISKLKIVRKNILEDKVQKLFQHLTTNNFIKWDTSKQDVSFGYNGEILKQNIKSEWLLSNLVHCEDPSFKFPNLKSDKNLAYAYESAWSLVKKFPLNLIETDYVSSGKKWMEDDNELQRYFQDNDKSLLRRISIADPGEATLLFHKHLRERKVWWRKFSSIPGRFSVTQIKENIDNATHYADIQAKFPWGTENVESIQLFTKALVYSPFFKVMSKKKNVIPHIITNEICLEKAGKIYLCDAYDALNEESDREMLRFHQKLAPYKIAFAMPTAVSGPEVQNGLKDLALHLARQIRKTGISTLLLPESGSVTQESQFLRNDALGIPYSIVVTEETLKDGLLGIRSRDTTLQEKSHVAELLPYLQTLVKS